MAKLVLSARLKPRREDGVDAEIAEFPDIKASAWSVGGAVTRLREAVWQRLRWTKVETSCAGEPISPIPQNPTSGDLIVPIDVEFPFEATAKDKSPSASQAAGDTTRV
jgi:hypothetical protein